ncbi:MAG: NAD(P)-binding protein [Leptolyngbyaceae cyanobacterium SL_7_1]|nr:NAD(P)-binding protein [Leptolyngbyaceae cyanobacterium SL_7_1]
MLKSSQINQIKLTQWGVGVIRIAVVGAGMAGLVCARRLQQGGYGVQVFEKSRGLGGRVATRRLTDTCADHGLRYVASQGEWTDRLILPLRQQGILHPWIANSGNPSAVETDRFIAPNGMASVAKWLAEGLTIARHHRVLTIAPQPDRTWSLTIETATATPSIGDFSVVVLAIPAPQAVPLVAPLVTQGLPEPFLVGLEAIEFAPCLTAIAQYRQERTPAFAAAPQAVSMTDSPSLAWLSLENSKRPSSHPIVVVQSTAAFAEEFLEATDLQPIGMQLLQLATDTLGFDFTDPELLQVHRWRYAFPRHTGQVSWLATQYPLPLLCCGDWCGGDRLETALDSGIKTAEQIHHWLSRHPLPPIDW